MCYVTMSTAQKLKFSVMNFFSRCKQGTAKLFTFTEAILNGKLYIFCRVATIYIPAKLIIIVKFLALWIWLFEMLEIWWLINNMKSLYYILLFNLAWIKIRLLEGKVQEETLKIQQQHDQMVKKVMRLNS